MIPRQGLKEWLVNPTHVENNIQNIDIHSFVQHMCPTVYLINYWSVFRDTYRGGGAKQCHPCRRRGEQEVEAALCLWINSCSISLCSFTFPLTCVERTARQRTTAQVATSFFLSFSSRLEWREREKVIRAGANFWKKVHLRKSSRGLGCLFKALRSGVTQKAMH